MNQLSSFCGPFNDTWNHTMRPCALQKCTHTLPRLLQLQKKWWTGVPNTETMESSTLRLDLGVHSVHISEKSGWTEFFCFLHAPPWTSAGLLLSCRLKRNESLVVFGVWTVQVCKLFHGGWADVRLLLLGERGHLWRSTNTRVRVTKNCHIWGVVGGDSDLRSVGIEKESWWLR